MRAVGGKSAFTLVELLVVVAIIALLISILIPSLTGAREYARRTVCKTNLHQFGLALAMYADDYDGFFPRYYGRYPTYAHSSGCLAGKPPLS